MITNVLFQIFDDCIPKSLYKNQEEFKKMFNLYLGLPLCVLHASENLKVNIRILCFPSKEEVYFYNQNSKKSGIVSINFGLIGHDTYVPLIKITQGWYFKYIMVDVTFKRS